MQLEMYKSSRGSHYRWCSCMRSRRELRGGQSAGLSVHKEGTHPCAVIISFSRYCKTSQR